MLLISVAILGVAANSETAILTEEQCASRSYPQRNCTTAELNWSSVDRTQRVDIFAPDGSDGWAHVCASERNRSQGRTMKSCSPDPWRGWNRETWMNSLCWLRENLYRRGTLCSPQYPCDVINLGSKQKQVRICLSPRVKSTRACEIFDGGQYVDSHVRSIKYRSLKKACLWGDEPRCFTFDLLAVLTFFKLFRKLLSESKWNQRVFLPNNTRTCAVVGSGHTLRCGADWGHALDDPEIYSSVWRVNRFPPQFNPKFYNSTGRRTTYGYGEKCGKKSAGKAVCLDKPVTQSRIAAVRYSSLGYGKSGGTVKDAAIALCDRVDVYGYGLFGSGDSPADLVYAHWYDDWISPQCARELPCYHEIVDSSVDSHAKMFRSFCNTSVSCDLLGSRVSKASEHPVDFYFRSELRLHVLDAFGFIRWIWW